MFKTLSLLEAMRANVGVPPTLLLLDRSYEPIREIFARWGFPLMMRMDYRSLPKAKPLGGIAIRSEVALRSVSDFLFAQNLRPLVHPHIDRFDDIFSVGILLTKGSFETQFEVVGRGFDASDLRLGKACPHESFTYDIQSDSISNRRQVAPGDYERERIERAKRVVRLHSYTNFANKGGRLLSSIERFRESPDEIRKATQLIPERYIHLGRRDIQLLAGLALRLKVNVLPRLPSSDSFVASLSLVPERGWILWDIYGHWYQR